MTKQISSTKMRFIWRIWHQAKKWIGLFLRVQIAGSTHSSSVECPTHFPGAFLSKLFRNCASSPERPELTISSHLTTSSLDTRSRRRNSLCRNDSCCCELSSYRMVLSMMRWTGNRTARSTQHDSTKLIFASSRLCLYVGDDNDDGAANTTQTELVQSATTPDDTDDRPRHIMHSQSTSARLFYGRPME